MFYEKVCIQNKFQILFTFANFSILITHYICRKASYAWVMSTLAILSSLLEENKNLEVYDYAFVIRSKCKINLGFFIGCFGNQELR